MPDPLITLTTDFGEESPYVAAMKGVILTINPAARLLDLSHAIPPQDIRHAAWFLAGALPWFPPGVIHLVVVDPGVGTKRELLCIELHGQRLLAPDNGCWTLLEAGGKPVVRRLRERRWWLSDISATFHGRDILAPTAAHLSLGVEPQALGPKTTRWVRLAVEKPTVDADGARGEVAFIDRFGNLITNIPATAIRQPPETLTVGGEAAAKFRWVRTYGEARHGSVVALTSSSGHLEVAVVDGDAAQHFAARIGTPVAIGWTR
ncbi:MAG: SAM-dependent chlorinase/fluorinase [Planctomycetia bacterium]|nr:SAM-dependent chlorinase/fluorinase [Planctomycetia bacterium]